MTNYTTKGGKRMRWWHSNILTNHSQGCLLAGAYGDSVGAGVEFQTQAEIEETYGPGGPGEPLGFPGLAPGTITDDTQQTLAVCRGLVRGARRGGSENTLLEDVWTELRAWAASQSSPSFNRSPGSTSLHALSNKKAGSIESPLNLSRSCGALMRAHPAGLYHPGAPEEAFRLGMKIGALTHGHPEGFVPAGISASIVSMLVCGSTFEDAVAHACSQAERAAEYDAARTFHLLRRALTYPIERRNITLEKNLEGWDGDEALAMAVYAVRCEPRSLAACSALAVTHNGDSDSVASVAGAVLGAMWGTIVVPSPWDHKLELAQELTQRARELAYHACEA